MKLSATAQSYILVAPWENNNEKTYSVRICSVRSGYPNSVGSTLEVKIGYPKLTISSIDQNVKAGDVINVTGTGFIALTNMLFGGLPLIQPVLVSQDTLQFKAPAMEGNFKLELSRGTAMAESESVVVKPRQSQSAIEIFLRSRKLWSRTPNVADFEVYDGNANPGRLVVLDDADSSKKYNFVWGEAVKSSDEVMHFFAIAAETNSLDDQGHIEILHWEVGPNGVTRRVIEGVPRHKVGENYFFAPVQAKISRSGKLAVLYQSLGDFSGHTFAEFQDGVWKTQEVVTVGRGVGDFGFDDAGRPSFIIQNLNMTRIYVRKSERWSFTEFNYLISILNLAKFLSDGGLLLSYVKFSTSPSAPAVYETKTWRGEEFSAPQVIDSARNLYVDGGSNLKGRSIIIDYDEIHKSHFWVTLPWHDDKSVTIWRFGNEGALLESTTHDLSRVIGTSRLTDCVMKLTSSSVSCSSNNGTAIVSFGMEGPVNQRIVDPTGRELVVQPVNVDGM